MSSDFYIARLVLGEQQDYAKYLLLPVVTSRDCPGRLIQIAFPLRWLRIHFLAGGMGLEIQFK